MCNRMPWWQQHIIPMSQSIATWIHVRSYYYTSHYPFTRSRPRSRAYCHNEADLFEVFVWYVENKGLVENGVWNVSFTKWWGLLCLNCFAPRNHGDLHVDSLKIKKRNHNYCSSPTIVVKNHCCHLWQLRIRTEWKMNNWNWMREMSCK